MIIKKYKIVFNQIIVLLLLYAATRLLFLLFNYSYFSLLENSRYSFFYGIRFDLVVICWLNALLFTSILLPFNFTEHRYYKRIYQILFVTINAIALLFNCIDIAYFEFIQKRSTFDLFQTLSGENDGMQVLPNYIADYWQVLLIWIGVIVALFICTKIKNAEPEQWSLKTKFIQIASILLVFIPLMVIGSRGGIQYRPLDMIGASNYAQGKNVSLVLNSPFCIMKSASKSLLEPVKYFNQNELSLIYSPLHYPKDSLVFDKKNIVIIILESVGSEYTALAKDGASLTPFLDSLSNRSIQYTNAFANGKTSIKGIPSIVAGIPTLFDGSFTYSAYNANNFESIASSLKKKGYTTSFYHGGNNGTMGFDVFTKAAGFHKYYGKNEYPNQQDDDGHWGIYDEPYLQYFKKQLDAEKSPFVASLFTLSSHHPYTLPEKYKNKFKGNELDISASIQYADYALNKFFDQAKKASWYTNTIFVITADHTSMSKNIKYQTEAGIYRIPLLVFDPQQAKGSIVEKTIQQIDIMPTILGKLNYDLPYFAFGNDVNAMQTTYAISFNGQYYQIITDNYCLQFDGEKTIAVFDMKQDELLKKNLVKEKNINYKIEETLVKAFVQRYNQCLIENKMTIKQ